MIKYLGNVEVDFYVSPQEPMWGCYLQTGKPCFSLRGLQPQPPTQASPSTGCIGHVSTPSPHQQKHSHLYYLFFSGLRWPNCSGSIFQPAAFVSKQLYLSGYGLFSPALSLLFYRLSLSFGSVAYGTYDSGSGADVKNQKSMCWAQCGSKGEMLAFLIKERKRKNTEYVKNQNAVKLLE